MFKNFWYGVEFSSDVQVGSPKKVKVLGQQLVLYRKPSDGTVVAMSDLCVHRGAALSGGELKGDCIVCPYHGWEYSPEGVVQKIPAHPEKGIPRKARIDAYPVVEKHMMIWVFMGDLPEEERPPIPDWSAVDDTETYRAVTGSVPVELQLRADPRERRRHRAHAVRARAASSATRRSPRCRSSRSRPRRGTARPRSSSTRRSPAASGAR